MRSLWLELDMYQANRYGVYWRWCEIEEISGVWKSFDLLGGLNPELDQVKGQILGKDHLQSLNEVHAYVKG